MKFSESWLREWVDPKIDSHELVSQLTMAGLEVDGLETAAVGFSGVVVGEIVSVEPHPNADKLRVCRVAGDGANPTQVVCGAPNARPGIKVPFALVGSVLSENFKIKKARLRGVDSFGMLCAEQELSISEANEGLWELPDDAPTGADLRSYLQLDDTLIELDLTPNRGDCLSVRGIAREVGVINRLPVKEPEIPAIDAVHDEVRRVELQAAESCPRYAGRVIRGIDASAGTPRWMQEKLRRSGLRSIAPVVDVTNYVLLELGQPMHAFDLDRLEGDIQVRMATQGEEIALLDGSTQKLRTDTLVIADAGRAVAIAGIMGGEETAVSPGTTSIFLESAFFKPLAMAGKARSYGMSTDSSHRFERGVDPQLQVSAVERATALLLDIVGGEAGPVIIAESEEHLPSHSLVTLHRSRLQQQLGMALPDDQVVEILAGLGFELVSESDKDWTLRSPSWRFDIEIEVDLIEEIARIYGYNCLPVSTPKMALAIEPKRESTVELAELRGALIASGYQEAITYSFIDPKLQSAFEPDSTPIALTNPISSDMGVMRTSLWPGLVSALQNNLNRHQSRVKLFETGLRFVTLDDGQLQQQKMIAGVACGSRFPESWAHNFEPLDFYDIKGDVEAMLFQLADASSISYQPAGHSALHPGQSARLLHNGKIAGFLGRLHPELQRRMDIARSVYLFEIELSAVSRRKLPHFTDLSRFPMVRRDLAFLIDESITAESIINAVRSTAGQELTDLKVFDVYQGKGIENNKKSIALGLTFCHTSRTLNETEVNLVVDRVVDILKEKYEASLRS